MLPSKPWCRTKRFEPPPFQSSGRTRGATVGLVLVNLFYVGLGIWGAAWVWRGSVDARTAGMVLVTFVAVRTIFFTTVETPEPRYVLECFPVVIALGAVGLGGFFRP